MSSWSHVDSLKKCQAFDEGRETERILDQIAENETYIQIKKKNPLVNGSSLLELQDFRLTSNILFRHRNCQTCGEKNRGVKQYHSCNCQVCKDKALIKPVRQCFRLDYWEMFLICEPCLKRQLALSQEFKQKNELRARMQKERKMKTKRIKKTFKKKKDLLRFIIELDSELSQYGVEYKEKQR